MKTLVYIKFYVESIGGKIQPSYFMMVGLGVHDLVSLGQVVARSGSMAEIIEWLDNFRVQHTGEEPKDELEIFISSSREGKPVNYIL